MKFLKNIDITKRLFASGIIIVILMVAVSGLFSMNFVLKLEDNNIDKDLLSIAQTISKKELVVSSLKENKHYDSLQNELNYISYIFDNVDVISICDTNGVRLYNKDPDKIGKKFIGGDETRILSGSLPYISEANGSLGKQRRAFCSVLDDNEQIIGFVLVSVLSKNITILRKSLFFSFSILLLISLLIGILVAFFYSKRLKKLLFGYNIEEFREIHLDREKVFNSLEEGLVAINEDGKIILINASAIRLLNLDQSIDYRNKTIDELYPELRLSTKNEEYNVPMKVNGRSLIVSRLIISENNKIFGALMLIRDKSEIVKLADELTGANDMLDTLRSVNHEFKNRLHVILGLLEMNQIDEAMSYIDSSNKISSEIVSNISNIVPNRSLAALLIGKSIRAKELGIDVTLRQDSIFNDSQILSNDEYVTIVGNLLDNSIDALNNTNKEFKEIELGFYIDVSHIMIICQDSGDGIDEKIISKIYEKGVSTKGEGRGNGLYLIKQIVDDNNGDIEIESTKNEGTIIEISF